MSLILNKRQFEWTLLIGVVIIAGLSTILRPSLDSKITLFRLLLPLLLAAFVMKKPQDMISVLWMSVILFVYNFFVSLYISRFQTLDLLFYFYSVIVLFWYFFVKYIVDIVPIVKTYNFLAYFYKTMIVLSFIQLFFGGHYPNTPIRPTEIIIFFYNGNEFAAVLAAFIPLYYLKETSKSKYLWIAAGLFFIIYNDARLCVIALGLFFVSTWISKVPIFKLGKLGIGLLVITVFSLLYILKDIEFFSGFVLDSMIFMPFSHIFNLEPVPHIGSINSRLNAVIFGTRELIDSNFFGIGLGNSQAMMAEKINSQNEGGVAYSMHNFVYQIITELGFLGLIYLGAIFKIVKKAIAMNTKFNSTVMWTFYICMTLNITLLSGPFSNYLFLFIFYYSIFHFKYNV